MPDADLPARQRPPGNESAHDRDQKFRGASSDKEKTKEAARDLKRALDEKEQVRARIEWFARWSDDVFQVPGTTYRVGLDPLVGLIPGVGDAASLIVSAYVPVEAWRQNAPWRLIGAMLMTIAVDALIGTVPLLGDVFDASYRANRRNAERLIEWMDREMED